MEIFNELVPKKNLCLALGFFDGVHAAHQKLLLKTVELAKENNLKSAVITFQKAPFAVLSGRAPEYITSLKEKTALISALGVDFLYVLDFSDYKKMTAGEYLNDVIIKNFSPKFVITGFNHTFGLNREGTSDFLKQNKSFNYIEIKPVMLDKNVISSTNIRNFIKSGDMKKAEKMLLRPFSYEGEVVKGAQIARKLGFNTANLIWEKELVKPKYGVYKGYSEFEGRKIPALINFGLRPTIDKNLKETLEVHLLNFEGNLYGKKLKTCFEEKIRDEIKFNSIEELKAQIEADYKRAAVQNNIKTE